MVRCRHTRDVQMFYKVSKFELVRSEKVEFNDLVSKYGNDSTFRKGNRG